jgi:hypothetical protein
VRRKKQARDNEMMSFKSIITEVESISANEESVNSSKLMRLAKDVQGKVDRETFDRQPELLSLRQPMPPKQPSTTQQTQRPSFANPVPQNRPIASTSPFHQSSSQVLLN